MTAHVDNTQPSALETILTAPAGEWTVQIGRAQPGKSTASV